MMKYLLLILLLIATPCYGEDFFKVKTGYLDLTGNSMKDSPVIELSYEKKMGHFGIEAGVNTFASRFSDIGMAYLVDPFIAGKIYFDKWVYVGSGVGYYYTFFSEYYEYDADLENEINGKVFAGIDFGKFIIEGRFTFADMDMETNSPYMGFNEDYSKFNNWMVVFGYKF